MSIVRIKSSKDILEYVLDYDYDMFHHILYDYRPIVYTSSYLVAVMTQAKNTEDIQYLVYDCRLKFCRLITYCLRGHYLGMVVNLSSRVVTLSPVRAGMSEVREIIKEAIDCYRLNGARYNRLPYPPVHFGTELFAVNTVYRMRELGCKTYKVCTNTVTLVEDSRNVFLYITGGRNHSLPSNQDEENNSSVNLDQYDSVWYLESSPCDFDNITVLTAEDAMYLEENVRLEEPTILYGSIKLSVTRNDDIITLMEVTAEIDSESPRLIRCPLSVLVDRMLLMNKMRISSVEAVSNDTNLCLPRNVWEKDVTLLPKCVGLIYNEMLDQLDRVVESVGYIDIGIVEYLLGCNDEVTVKV